MPELPSLDELMSAAVSGVGGVPRPGQSTMANAVQEAIERDEHLLVQAGTGTGKSLAYLVPAIRHAFEVNKPAIVATATLALQAQIVDRDMPRLADALEPLLGRRPTYALVKGRRNYLCQHKLTGGYPDDDEGALMGVGQVDEHAGRTGREVVRLREWADETESGDRDELVPGVSERAWRQVSVSSHECLGSKCPVVEDCFVEMARADAKEVDVVVTNHSFMAIDAFEGRQMLPEHDLLVVDEAHELVDRVTATITDELTTGTINAAAKRCGRLAETDDLKRGAEVLGEALEQHQEGRLLGVSDVLEAALRTILDASRSIASELKPKNPQDNDGVRQMARAAIDEIFETCERILEERELDVLWVSHNQRTGVSALRVAPMSVAMLMRDKIFGERSVVMTSATLELGGSFDAVAGTLGLRGAGGPQWKGLDVGSPFDYPKQGIAYVAQHLPPPGRDGLSPQALDEIETLVRAAGGRTLGLFSSMRAAQAAAEAMRERFGDEIPVLCQGEDQMGTLVRTFAADARTCLFGTLTLWQGVDVPGSSLQLVIIDRIPFPRPDDPLASARSQAIAKMGGNGFMAVSATHAALRLAQGAGRLIRHTDDRGVVAFLDSRMMTARYAGFLQRSLPPFWPTTDRALILKALARLDENAPDVTPPPAAGTRSTKQPSVPSPSSSSVRSSGASSASSAASSGLSAGSSADAKERALAAAAAAGVSGMGTASAIKAPTKSTPPPVDDTARTAVTGGEAWTAESDEELREGVSMGLSAEELADHLELSAESVLARCAQLGIRPAGE
ncbi:ATP-dependent DNA helicase [Dermacoccus abyssi]|uniref:ATP-dependent DNA helicase n=1 Tax=Dermacoccus abyssi TaxID=322596 RepID=UPI002AD595D2|nr:ATP-dependent DNA helicase [Dermacoccus abyssi]